MRMRYIIFVVLFLSSLAFSGTVYAGEATKEHGHKTPHGGVIQEAEGMHAEFLLDKNSEPKLFLYDKGMKPIERDMQAMLTVKAHDGTEHKRDLKFSKDPKEGPLFKGEAIKGLTDWDTAVVSVKMKDGWKHIRFSHHSDGHGH